MLQKHAEIRKCYRKALGPVMDNVPVVPPACSTSGMERSNTCRSQGQDFWSSCDRAHGYALSFSRTSMDILSFLSPRGGRNIWDPSNTDEDMDELCWGPSNRADTRKTCGYPLWCRQSRTQETSQMRYAVPQTPLWWDTHTHASCPSPWFCCVMLKLSRTRCCCSLPVVLFAALGPPT